MEVFNVNNASRIGSPPTYSCLKPDLPSQFMNGRGNSIRSFARKEMSGSRNDSPFIMPGKEIFLALGQASWVHPIALTVQHNGWQVNPRLSSKLSLDCLQARITSRRAV